MLVENYDEYSHRRNLTIVSLDFSFGGIEGFEYQLNLDPQAIIGPRRFPLHHKCNMHAALKRIRNDSLKNVSTFFHFL